MSTTAIRKALRDMQCDTNPCLPGLCRKHEAMTELEAIQKAGHAMASDMDMGAIRHAPSNIREAVALMIEIGKEKT